MNQKQDFSEAKPDGYENFYRDFETPLMQEIRRQIYGEDIGLHNWGTIQELRNDHARLNISKTSRIADLGCGPCGALTAILAAARCRGTGVDRSAAALRAGQARAAGLGVADLMDVQMADLDEPLPFPSASFDAIQAVDTVPHLRDRQRFFLEVARLLRPGGRFLCIDSCILTGAISNQDLNHRLAWGYTQIAPMGWNDGLLEATGFQLVDCEDRSAVACRIAEVKASVYRQYRAELKEKIRSLDFEPYLLFLETAAKLWRQGVMARMMFYAKKRSL